MHKIKYVDPKEPDKVLTVSSSTKSSYSGVALRPAEVKAQLLKKGFKLVGKRK